jgi:hypothetical protein
MMTPEVKEVLKSVVRFLDLPWIIWKPYWPVWKFKEHPANHHDFGTAIMTVMRKGRRGRKGWDNVELGLWNAVNNAILQKTGTVSIGEWNDQQKSVEDVTRMLNEIIDPPVELVVVAMDEPIPFIQVNIAVTDDGGAEIAERLAMGDTQ